MIIFDVIGVLEIIFVIVGGVVCCFVDFCFFWCIVSWNLGLRVVADVTSDVSSSGFVRFWFFRMICFFLLFFNWCLSEFL